jgi:uncharacterized protein
MNIILFGGTGAIGQRIYSEAISRGHQVAVFVRPGREIQLSPPPARVSKGDLANADDVAAAVRGQSAVVSALGPREDVSTLLPIYETLAAGLTKAGTRRLLVVGGAGSLEVAPGKALYKRFANRSRLPGRSLRRALGARPAQPSSSATRRCTKRNQRV